MLLGDHSCMKFTTAVLFTCIILADAVFTYIVLADAVSNLSVMEKCPFCERALDDGSAIVRLREKGADSVNKASKERKLDVSVSPGQVVHTDCRRDFIHPRNSLPKCDKNNNTFQTRSSYVFDFRNKCLFCTKDVKFSNRKHGYDVYPVRSIDFQETIRQKCFERNDAWSHDVLARLSLAIDLPAADAVYHQQCNVNFRTLRQIPKSFLDSGPSPSKRSPGRPDCVDTAEAFKNIITFIEDNEGDVLTVTELVTLMEETCGERAYSNKHMKKKLKEHFGDSISISTLEGRDDRVTLKRTASEIIHKFAKEHVGLSEEEQKKKIISTAGQLIKADINSIQSSKTFYPPFSTISSVDKNTQYLPDSLKLLLSSIFCGSDADIKLASIGQAIIQACRPKSLIVPLQIGLGVQLHHHFGSRFLIDVLNNLGFASSYFEVQNFEANAAAAINTTIPGYFPGQFLQFVADNADHNIRTLDGHNTFHGMGIIACTTPGSSVTLPVPRTDVSTEELSKIGKIDVKFFKYPEKYSPSLVQFNNLSNIDEPNAGINSCDMFDCFSRLIWPLKPSRPNWSGFMQLYYSSRQDTYPGKSSITFLPMIDMSPSDLSCINSTLHFVCDQARKYGVAPVLTFDQPLFQKATYIINCCKSTSPLKKIILRLGRFHTEMSFLGSIGHIMSGSGLQEVLHTVYAPNAVSSMLAGKSVQRAIRAHFLVDTALHALLLSTAFNTQLPSEPLADVQVAEDNVMIQSEDGADKENSYSVGNDCETDAVSETSYPLHLLDQLSDIYDKLEQKKISKTDLCLSQSLNEVHQRVTEVKTKLNNHRTARLWLQYIDMVSVLQQFIRAERTGDWTGHLKALKRMLPYFAASGHYLYLKSAYIYLQNMVKLETEHPVVYQQFLSGNHSIRRSDRYWAGLSTDLTIEQVLMRSLKTNGGLTRGRVMSETQRTLWLLSMPANAEMNNAMQQFTGTSYVTSDQHKESRSARSIRDEHDTRQLLTFLRDHSPFDESDETLRNIETGVTADDKVNVDKARERGEWILSNMVGKSCDEYKFKRANQVVVLNEKNSIKVTGESITIDPQLLFQRLTTVADRYTEDVSAVFRYGLCSIPSALFDNTGLPRAPQKSLLADAIWKTGDCGITSQEATSGSQSMHVIDGGSLIQKIMWQKNGTFGLICQQYYNYLQQKYEDMTVVFDGYLQGPSIKDITHYRRSMGSVGTRVKFTYNTPFKSKKDTFLKNTENKQNFIDLLGNFLVEKGIPVKHATGDADCLIVETALEFAETRDTYVIGEDTDLLVLLCHLVNGDSKKVYFRSDMRQSTGKPNKIWDIHNTQRVLTSPVCELLPFLHAVTGCDTTSRIYGIGKAAALRLLRTHSELRETARQFMTSDSKADILKLGEKAIILLLNGDTSLNLDVLRFRKFATKVMASTACVLVHTLPPTSAAAAYHSLRVYFQCQTWIGNSSLRPDDWGWELKEGMYLPVKTDLPPAPDNLLNVVRCNCKSNCDSKRCTCRKHGLECSVGCGACRGVSCSNSNTLAEMEIDMEENEYVRNTASESC